MVNPTANKMDKAKLGKWLTTLLIPIIIYLIPANETFSVSIRLFLVITVFAILLIAFELFDYMFIAILLPTAYILSGLAPATAVFGGWTGTIPFMIVGGYLLSNVLTDTNLMKRIAYWCIIKVGGTYNGILFGIVAVAIIINYLTSGNGIMIIVTMCVGLCQALDLGKSKESALLLLTGAMASSFSSTGFVYAPQFLAMLQAGGSTVIPGFAIEYLQFMLQTCPWILFLFLVTFIATKVFKTKGAINGKAYFAAEYKALGTMGAAEKKAAVITVLMLIFLMTTKLHGIALEWGFIIFPWLFFLPGIDIGRKENITQINYPMIFFMIACISIGAVSGYLGFGPLLSSVLMPILAPLGTNIVVVIIWLLGIVLNMLMTPMAVIGAFSAPVAQLAVDLGINPTGALYALLNSMDMVVMPYEAVPYLIAFSFGFISMQDFIKYSLFKIGLGTVFFVVVMLPFWHIIGVL